MILGIINILLAFLNLVLSFYNNEKGNYKLAIFCAWASGFCLAAGLTSLIGLD